MACSSMTLKIAYMLLMCMVISAPLSLAQPVCDQVAAGIKACEVYLTQGGTTVPLTCCIGWSNVVNAVSSSNPGHQIACLCLKTATSNLNIDYTAANQLSTECGLTTNFKLSSTLTCS